MEDKSRNLWILINEGKGDKGALGRAVARIRDRGHRVQLCVVRAEAEAGGYVGRAVEDGADVVVAVGGDGSVSRVVRALHRRGALDRCAIGVVPAGTGNDFATANGIPADPEAALRLAAEAAPRAIDLGLVNGRPFVNAASGGYGAEVTVSTPPDWKQALGGFAYFVNGLLHIPEARGSPARVSGPEMEWEGPLVGFSVCNGRRTGGGFQVAPAALLDDGLLDLALFPAVPAGRWLEVAAAAVVPGDDGTGVYPITAQLPELEVLVQEELLLTLDGEPMRGTSFRFEVLPGRLRFCLPGTTGLLRE